MFSFLELLLTCGSWVLGGKLVRGEKGGKIGESLKKLQDTEILVSPRVCDQVAALTEGLSTDYALVWLFT